MAYRKAGGFTLLELLITLAVAAVITALAVPSFRSITARNRLAISANQLLGAMLEARTVAITRNVPVTFCAGSASDGCHRDWTKSEWIIFIDRNRDAVLDANDIVHRTETLPSSGAVTLAGNGPFTRAVVFLPSGIARWPDGGLALGRLRVCTARPIANNATDLVLIGSGRAAAVPQDFDGTCPVP